MFVVFLATDNTLIISQGTLVTVYKPVYFADLYDFKSPYQEASLKNRSFWIGHQLKLKSLDGHTLCKLAVFVVNHSKHLRGLFCGDELQLFNGWRFELETALVFPPLVPGNFSLLLTTTFSQQKMLSFTIASFFHGDSPS